MEDYQHLTKDVHIIANQPLPSPEEIIQQYPTSEIAAQTVFNGRQTIKRMMRNADMRLLVIVGPCSIHDEKAAYEYAQRLKELQQKVKENFFLVMRVYFEKPRTVIGWRGLINDPDLDGSSDIIKGLHKARQILLALSEMEVPIASELLDPVVPQYISDLISWAAIGARTTESQIHREMASGLSMPVGFKNSTDGNLQIAIDAIQSSRFSHHFVGINVDGKMHIWKSSGNIWGHIILRGGRDEPNYHREKIEETAQRLEKAKLPPFVVVDCSHANSQKVYKKQVEVWNDLIQQTLDGNEALRGIMLESHLHEGNQKIPENLSQLKYGVSVTDPCINWETTERIILEANNQFERYRSK